MRENYAKVFQSIVFSSVWEQDDATRIVWLTLMVMADKHGEVTGNVHSLARVAKVSTEACERALDLFLNPDPGSRTETCEGRRLQTVEGGWALVNHDTYTSKASAQDRREQAARRQQRYREREAAKTRGTEALGSESEPVTVRNAPSRSVTVSDANLDMEMEMEMEPERGVGTHAESPPRKTKANKGRPRKPDPFAAVAIRKAVEKRVGLCAIPGFIDAVVGWSEVLREKRKPWATPEALESCLLKIETGHLSDALEIVELCRVNAWKGWIAGRDHLARERGQSNRSQNPAATRGPEHEPF